MLMQEACVGLLEVIVLTQPSSSAAFPRGHAHAHTRTSQSALVLVLTQVSIIDTRHNHYSWCAAAAELLVMQRVSGCACQVSLTTV